MAVWTQGTVAGAVAGGARRGLSGLPSTLHRLTYPCAVCCLNEPHYAQTRGDTRHLGHNCGPDHFRSIRRVCLNSNQKVSHLPSI